MERPRQRASDTEPIQADPQLRLSQGGRATGIHITLVAIACMLLVSLMIYALNQPTTEDVAATAPAAQETTGAPAPGAAAPQTGGNVAGGENAAPPTEAAPQNQPAQEPVPQQTKPGVVPDDSQR